jgi:hypothetical protein
MAGVAAPAAAGAAAAAGTPGRPWEDGGWQGQGHSEVKIQRLQCQRDVAGAARGNYVQQQQQQQQQQQLANDSANTPAASPDQQQQQQQQLVIDSTNTPAASPDQQQLANDSANTPAASLDQQQLGIDHDHFDAVPIGTQPHTTRAEATNTNISQIDGTHDDDSPIKPIQPASQVRATGQSLLPTCEAHV